MQLVKNSSVGLMLYSNIGRNFVHVMLFVFVALFLVGCGSNNFKVSGYYPTPMVNKIPIKLGVQFEPAFKNYVYHEKSEDRSEWEIELGEAQTQLFNTVLPAMFSEVHAVTEISQGANSPDIDLVLSPVLTELQYNLPRETKVKIYEVWLKFNIRVYEPNGELIADWILTSYGKTPTKFMTGKETALNQAMVVALRDAGAGLSLTFTKVPEINSWLAKMLNKHSKPRPNNSVAAKSTEKTE